MIQGSMMDFYSLKIKKTQRSRQAYPNFINGYSQDIMIRDGNFVAVWDAEKGLWSFDETVVIRDVDRDVSEFAQERSDPDDRVIPLLCCDDDSGVWKKFNLWVKNMVNTDHPLDRTPIFQDSVVRKEDYASYRLPYTLNDREPTHWNKMVGTLYEPSEKEKIEWCIGSVLTGASRKIQKFFVFYGEPGSGKSTIMNIMGDLFGEYATAFNSEGLGNLSNNFAMSDFAEDPLVAIEHDGDLSRIETNARLNSIISHEKMIVNEKFKKPYTLRITTMLIMGTNSPVKITDANSGIPRRLVDIRPSNHLFSIDEYHDLMEGVSGELGGIARQCIEVFRSLGPNYYKDYRANDMREETDPIYNFVLEMYDEYCDAEYVSLPKAYEDYKSYAEAANLRWVAPRHVFRRELRHYFEKYHDRYRRDDGRIRSVFTGFRKDLFASAVPIPAPVHDESNFLELAYYENDEFDRIFAEQPAQLATEDGAPQYKWENVETTLRDIDRNAEHFVRLPDVYIAIDFDLKDPETGAKDLGRNLKAASAWPPTYAEVSRSGQGLHLIYKYDGPETLSEYAPGIEIKRFHGKASLRRRYSLSNDHVISNYEGILPMKRVKMINSKHVESENHLRVLIAKALRKEIHPDTSSSIDFIKAILDDAKSSGMVYDVTDARPAVISFAAKSTNQAQRCLALVKEMAFSSAEEEVPVQSDDGGPMTFFDVEVFPNLFVVVYKEAGGTPKSLVNPKASDIRTLMDLKLVGFNNRNYDNHILYAASLGYSNGELYHLSKRIIDGDRNAKFREAYSVSYTDIYDFSSKKQSLKKWEIELGIHHQELGLKWDEPVPEDLWDTVADYCENDVVATEKVFDHLSDDWQARKILASISGRSVNDSTNTHTCAILFGSDRNPQSKFVYTDLSTIFPGYTYDPFKGSEYRGEDPGEGGYVYAEEGYYENVALLDVASMHPTSLIELNAFGPYTQKFKELTEARIAIKHGDMEALGKLFNGELLELAQNNDHTKLAYALKIAINSVYGLTSAHFDNPARDPRNVDNIVAKRGALFMIDLKHYVQEELGATVAHIKTDSIKIPGATDEIIQKVLEFGKRYGYTFEHEATYEKMVLVNKAVYIAKYKHPHDGEWVAVGKQFQEPYVFKKLFANEPIEFEDYTQTRQVKTAMYLKFEDGSTHYVGRVGSFVPIKEGFGGGALLRENASGEIKDSVTDTKGYFWKEAEVVKFLGEEQNVDTSYAENLADEARKTIEQFINFDTFTSN